MGIDAGLYMYNIVVEKFTFAISSADEFLVIIMSSERSVNTDTVLSL